MSEFLENMQDTLRRNSQSIGLFVLRFISGIFWGVVLTLIMQQVLGYGQLLFWFVIVLITALVVKLTKSWKWTGVVVLDFVLILMGLLLKMYILIAPGS
jgi:hypothetical protein